MPSNRHLSQLNPKSYDVAPGDVNGGLIYAMPKPMGIGEGFLGISIDSAAYREYVGQVLYTLEMMVQKDIRSKASPLINQLLDRYQALRQDPIFWNYFNSVDNEAKIDMLLKDKVHHKRRYGFSLKELAKLVNGKLYDFHFPWQQYTVNEGMGGLLFNAYQHSCNIKESDPFYTKIAKLIAGSKDPEFKSALSKHNKVYMIKGDGVNEKGGTYPNIRLIMRTGAYNLLNRVPPVAYVVARIQHALRRNATSLESNNTDIIIETVATKMASKRGLHVQSIDTIPGTYEDGSPKTVACVSWRNGFSDFSKKVHGGKEKNFFVRTVASRFRNLSSNHIFKDQGNVIVRHNKHGFPVHVDNEGHLMMVRKGEDGLNYIRVKANGDVETISKKVYDKGLLLSEHRIRGLGRAAVHLIAFGDRDGMGSKGQNKGVLPMKPKDGYTMDFYGIDFGNSYRAANPILETLHDDFSFITPTIDAKRFKNYALLNDTSLVEKMKGVYLLAALKGVLDETQKRNIIEDFRVRGDEDFASELEGYPESVGGYNSDTKLIEEEIALNQAKIDSEPNEAHRKKYEARAERLQDTLRLAQKADEDILKVFEQRKGLTPSQIEVLDSVEKLTAHQAQTRSPDGKVILNHIRVDREDRAPWQLQVNQDGTYNLYCTEANTKKRAKILQRLQQSPDFQGLAVNDQLRIPLTADQLQRLQQNLTEQTVANQRGLHFVTREARLALDKHVLAAEKSANAPEASSTQFTPLATPAPMPDPVVPAVVAAPPPTVAPLPPQNVVTHRQAFSPRTGMVLHQEGQIAELKTYLDNADHCQQLGVINTREFPELSSQSGLAIQFTDTTIYAKQKPNHEGLLFSAQRNLSDDDFLKAALATCRLAIYTGKPNATYHIAIRDEQRQRILEDVFEQVRQEAVEAKAFTQENVPRLSSSAQPKANIRPHNVNPI